MVNFAYDITLYVNVPFSLSFIFREIISMDKLRKALSGQDNRDNDSSTGILPVSVL